MRILFCILLLWPLPSLARINVVTSIQPLYLVTKAIMRGVGDPEILIKKDASAHHFGFRPSHLRKLTEADLVIWVDRNFESGFQRLGEILPQDTESVELLQELDLNIADGHFWYSPVLLIQAIEHIQSALGRINPQHAPIFSGNANELSRLIENWGKDLRSGLKNRPPLYLLDHNFLGQFEQDMGVEAVAVLHDSHDQPGSLKDLQDIEKKLQRASAKCLLTNQEPASRLARNIAQKYDLPIYNITRTTEIAVGQPDYLGTLRQLGTILLSCR